MCNECILHLKKNLETVGYSGSYTLAQCPAAQAKEEEEMNSLINEMIEAIALLKRL